jgi:hypothetical protein
MSEYKTENFNNRISIDILFLFIITEHESAKENNMFLNDHCCFKKLISIRTSPRTIFETNFLRSYEELFKSFQMMYYMTLFGICVNEQKDI